MVKAIMHGCNGHMGQVITGLIKDDPEIEIVIELIGGIEPARTYILEALEAGKNVVTANKDLIAEYGKELYDAAKEGSADFLFEAAVAGGIPIIRPLKQCLEGNQIDEIMGIVNGTTNYILTKMFQEGSDFDDVLKQAQALRGMTLYMNRDDVELEEGAFFIQDVIGLPVYDERVGREIGVVKEISDGPAGDLYIIQDGKTQHMIPGVPEFLKEVDLEHGRVTVHTIEGLLSDEI